MTAAGGAVQRGPRDLGGGLEMFHVVSVCIIYSTSRAKSSPETTPLLLVRLTGLLRIRSGVGVWEGGDDALASRD